MITKCLSQSIKLLTQLIPRLAYGSQNNILDIGVGLLCQQKCFFTVCLTTSDIIHSSLLITPTYMPVQQL